MHNKKCKIFCITTFLAGIIFSGSVFATDLEIQLTKEYEKWNELVAEEKETTFIPRTYSPILPQSVLKSADETKIPNMTNALVESLTITNKKNILKDIESAYLDTTYHMGNRLNLRVENQGTTTQCWTFSMLKSLETNIALRNNVKEIMNFSERHMNYATSKTFTDGINEKGFEREVGIGGLPVTALAYLTNGQGAVLESEMPFEDNENKISLSSIDKVVDTVVTDYVVLPSLVKRYTKDANGNTIKVEYMNLNGNIYTNEEVKAIRNTIKKHIVEDGAIPSVTAANNKKFYNNSDNIRKATAYNCNDATAQRDHAITIVGWDDNYSKDNFPEGAKPSTDGAYIVLNSYGEDSFDNGYLYISYEDYSIESEIYVVKNSEKKDYDAIYQSDFYGGIFSMGTKSINTGYYANVYKRDNTKVEYVTDVGITISDYANVEIYLNPNSDSMNQDSLIKIGENEELLEPGYHRLKVEHTKLNAEKFSVVVKQKSENGTFYFCIESPVENSAYACVDSENNSYYSLNGEIWKNIAEEKIDGFDMKRTDVCIKVFVEEELKNPTDDPSEEPSEEPGEDPGEDPSKDPSEEPSEEPGEDPSKDPSDNPGDQKEDITIQSEKYLIREEEICKIISETSINELKKNIQTQSNIRIFESDKEITTNDVIVKTGMKLKLDNGKEYILIVRGDVNSDGKVTLTDLSKMILHYNETKGFILENNSCKAADMNYDEKVSLVDISQILILYNSK